MAYSAPAPRTSFRFAQDDPTEMEAALESGA